MHWKARPCRCAPECDVCSHSARAPLTLSPPRLHKVRGEDKWNWNDKDSHTRSDMVCEKSLRRRQLCLALWRHAFSILRVYVGSFLLQLKSHKPFVAVRKLFSKLLLFFTTREERALWRCSWNVTVRPSMDSLWTKYVTRPEILSFYWRLYYPQCNQPLTVQLHIQVCYASRLMQTWYASHKQCRGAGLGCSLSIRLPSAHFHIFHFQTFLTFT